MAQIFGFVADLFYTDRSLIGGIGCKGGLAMFFLGSFGGLNETGLPLKDMNIIKICYFKHFIKITLQRSHS